MLYLKYIYFIVDGSQTVWAHLSMFIFQYLLHWKCIRTAILIFALENNIHTGATMMMLVKANELYLYVFSRFLTFSDCIFWACQATDWIKITRTLLRSWCIHYAKANFLVYDFNYMWNGCTAMTVLCYSFKS